MSLPPAESADRAEEIESGPQSRPVRSGAGIYGLIVTASVISVGGPDLGTLPLALAIFVTLLIYWVAEEYGGLVEHASAGHLPTWAHIRAAMEAKWPIVSASYLPLLSLLLARLLGAEPPTAALITLIVIVVLLTVYGWTASRSAGLRGLPQFGMTVLAGGFGVLMILLKAALSHLH